MLDIVRFVGVLLAGALWSGPVLGQPNALPASGAATFNVFFRSALLGVERVELTRSAEGWVVRSSGQLSAPLGLDNRLSEIRYDQAWNPSRLEIDSSRDGEDFLVQTVFDGAVATSTINRAGQEVAGSEPVEADSVVLPDFFFGAYEALAARLAGKASGDELPVYVVPGGTSTARVDETLEHRLETAGRPIQARVFRITLTGPEQVLRIETWVDPDHRLLRLTMPQVGLDVARTDVVSVATRLAGVTVAGDEPARVSAAGFGLAGTVTTPPDRSPPEDGWPAVVLVPGTNSTDRDEFVLGVPLHGRLAEALAGEGFLVVRYDRRGVGQSGGRPESAELDDYVDDLRAVLRYLDRRDDVDDDRLAVVAHGEGGWIALRAASRDNRIAAVALLATPGTPGPELVLEQQESELDRLGLPEEDRRERIALQRRIHTAILEDGSWDDVPAELRARADTPWFRSFLAFDPAEVMRRTRQPMLILHGTADRHVAPPHATRLHDLATARRRRESTVRLETLGDVNHAMVRVTPGAAADPGPLRPARLDEAVTAALTEWLVGVMAGE